MVRASGEAKYNCSPAGKCAIFANGQHLRLFFSPCCRSQSLSQIYSNHKRKKEPTMSTETKKEKESTMNVEATQTHLFTRQPPSVLGRIALWAFLVGALGGIGGNIAITLGSGSPSRDLLITTVIGLASAVILATRFRWAPLVSTLLGGYNLYLAFIQPYVIESLV